VTATASAVNELTLANAATGGVPTLTASGDDTNIGFELISKGTGEITANVNGKDVFNASSSIGFKNRIINGAMVSDQRNAGASVTPVNGYTVDRFRAATTQTSKFTVQQNAGSVTPPAGFKNYLGITSSSAYSVLAADYFLIGQPVEGFNTADLGFGAAGASSITFSFWVRSSLTGTFGGAINNSAFNRSYPFSYTISAANTWEQKSVTIAGDTTGTWIGATNGVGLYAWFNLGTGSTGSTTANAWASGSFYAPTGATSVVGTNGATFYITGVQLEKGSTATSFDYRPYGTELALCQRYFEKSYVSGTVPATVTEVGVAYTLVGNSAGNPASNVYFKVSKRTTPTELSIYSSVTGTIAKVRNSTAGTDENSTAYGTSENGFAALGSTSTSATCFRFQWTAGSEL